MLMERIYWPGICGNSSIEWAYWDNNVTWFTSSPDLTICFQMTVLQWLPCSFLWLGSILYIPYLNKRQFFTCAPISALNLFKLILCLLLLGIAIIDFSHALSAKSVPLVTVLNPLIQAATIMMLMFLIRFEYRKGIHSSGFLFIFWFLIFLSSLLCVTSQSNRILKTPADLYSPILTILTSAINLIQLLLHCFADKKVFQRRFRSQVYRKESQPLLAGGFSTSLGFEEEEDENLKNSCPELQASFLNRITFAWITPLIIKGYKRSLKFHDLWDLRPMDACVNVLAKFENAWKKHLQDVHRKNNINSSTSEYGYYSNVKHDRTDSKSSEVHVFQTLRRIDNKGSVKNKASIISSLARTFGTYFVFIGFLKLITDLANFVQPQLLKQLINFLSAEDQYQWHGFLFAISLFLVAMFRTILMHQYWIGCFLIGLRLRTAIIGVVYRKSIKLSSASRKNTTIGEIVNLMSVDAQKVERATIFLHNVWSAPLRIIVAIAFLWQELGASAMAGVFIMIILIPINGCISSKVKRLQRQQMQLKDQRIKLINEMLNGVKVLKLFAWEESFKQKIEAFRNKELLVLRKAAYLVAVGSVTLQCAPLLVALTTFAVYVLSSPDNLLTSQKAFVSLSLFNIMSSALSQLPNSISGLVQLSVSLDRINRYLTEDELDPHSVEHNPLAQPAIEIIDGTFSWDQDTSPVLSDVNLAVPDGKLWAVVGTVGSGKSSLVSSILGELQKITGRVIVKGSTAYVPQQPWCLNCSLQDNILFGRNLHRHKYSRVLDACALRPDLKMLADGDKTEIGEKGINLSGGQKQRVSLARAVYHDCDIYLLDDPLSAVDSHVGKHLFEQVISSRGLLGNKTRILVTHGLSFLPKADCIVVLKDGVISEMGSYNQLLSHDGAFAEYIRTYLEKEVEEEDDEEEVKMKVELRRTISVLSGSESEAEAVSQRSRSRPSLSSKRRLRASMTEDLENLERQRNRRKLVTEEVAATGKVKRDVYWWYIKAFTSFAFCGFLIAYLFYITCQVSSNIWLSYWSDDTSAANDTAARDLYLGVYGGLGAGQSLFILIQNFCLAYGAFFASQRLHNSLLDNIMKTPMSFFDSTPIGRILNRFGKDTDIVDLNIPATVRNMLNSLTNVVGTLIVVTIASPVFLIALIPMGIYYYFIQLVYIATSRQLKRIDSVKRSPIYSHFQESIVGAASVRAFEKQQEFTNKSDNLVDDNQKAWYHYLFSNRWMGFLLESVGNTVILLAAVFAVVSRSTVSPGLAAAAVTYALQLTNGLNVLVRNSVDLETQIVAIERILEYCRVAIEGPWVTQRTAGSSWPSGGQIEFQNFSVRYRPDLDLVLRRINFTINSGEMVGIVGRTGAGKSSLTMGLFRILEAAGGKILIDGVDIASIGLQELRSQLTIIPQDPVLFSGTLRMNLDPSDAHSDGQIWAALDQAHLRTFVSSLRDGLRHQCAESGENLSVGQRQLFCLARALLRKSKVLVLDEATAAVDLETDDLIQNTIRREFRGRTVLTIAHRLNTIMDYDRIAVLDKGELKEYDTPKNLITNSRTIFHGMCRDAGLV